MVRFLELFLTDAEEPVVNVHELWHCCLLVRMEALDQ
jgi:hypothetical protein